MKKAVEYIIDDVVVIPDDIKNMSLGEIEAEIARLEAEAEKKRDRLRREKELAAV